MGNKKGFLYITASNKYIIEKLDIKLFNKLGIDKSAILKDYKTALLSREVTKSARDEVFSGKAKFGIFGDGKEIAQVAMAHFFKKGDWRSGYYRDQTLMFALNEITVKTFFAQLYGHTDIKYEPCSGGRMMNAHFATRILDENGKWKNQLQQHNTSADVSCTAGQIPRMIGLAFASKLYRNNQSLHYLKQFSNKGNEIVFGTIGDASTSEGHFWEGMNAAGVDQLPLVINVWDDGYGISVPTEYHTVKSSISEAIKGFQRTKQNQKGFEIRVVKGWDYPTLLETYKEATNVCRKQHVPFLIHVTELTQPYGHSTSGSHKRYKSKERLEWENKHDPITKMKQWIVDNKIATQNELKKIENKAIKHVNEEKQIAFQHYNKSKENLINTTKRYLKELSEKSNFGPLIKEINNNLSQKPYVFKYQPLQALKQAMRLVRFENLKVKKEIGEYLRQVHKRHFNEYNEGLYNNNNSAATKVNVIPAKYSDQSPTVDGSHVVRACFEAALNNDPRVFAMGEDVGKIGDVNQGMAGLQEQFGKLRVMDTSIRETTIIGQAIGTALRGLKPIAEIQYVDYILYAIQVLSDDIATLRYRTKGGQQAPLIIRTRGHRLEGIWHSGSPMSLLLGSIRGIHLLVPRNMVQAAGMYNTILKSDDPAIVVETLNGYRIKETLPDNIGEFTVPIGHVEVIREGEDITLVTYGALCRITMTAAERLQDTGISCEVIDVQSLLPFDLTHRIGESVKKTNRIVIIDEDVPNGTSAYILGELLEKQSIFEHLDAKPKLVYSYPNRPAYNSDGNYFSKPNEDDVFDFIYKMMHEANPRKYPSIYDLNTYYQH